MVFGIDPIKLAKQELLKHKALGDPTIPDVLEGLDAAEAALETLAVFVGGLDINDMVSVLNFFNSLLHNKRSTEEIVHAADALVKVPTALRAAKDALEKIEAQLK